MAPIDPALKGEGSPLKECFAAGSDPVKFKKGLTSHVPVKPLDILGAGARNRTEMGSPPRDFESRASTNFTTPAENKF